MRLRVVTEAINGSPIVEVAERFGASRQTVTAWRKRYEAKGLDVLVDASRRPHSSPATIIAKVNNPHEPWLLAAEQIFARGRLRFDRR
ncbi:helix-turn-helix domain-containing protein [Rhodococcus sovatensis]|uniref:helix-turn-helix domain-containing protein n=1 Tax=Rhodococcus sovatensis TaxID=1805840 RepID=UPI003BAE2407